MAWPASRPDAGRGQRRAAKGGRFVEAGGSSASLSCSLCAQPSLLLSTRCELGVSQCVSTSRTLRGRIKTLQAMLQAQVKSF